jgi:hypothetical protein
VLRDRLGPWSLSFLLILAATAAPRPAAGQTARSFRVTWTVEKAGPVSTEVGGRVTNDARVDAIDVYVTVEGLDEKGKVLARGLTHVSSMLRASESATFTAKVPVVPGIQSYRALVSSFRFGLGGPSQAP